MILMLLDGSFGRVLSPLLLVHQKLFMVILVLMQESRFVFKFLLFFGSFDSLAGLFREILDYCFDSCVSHFIQFLRLISFECIFFPENSSFDLEDYSRILLACNNV